MAAPKGNKFWLARSSHGRNPKFESAQQLWAACLEYFDWVHDNPLGEALVYQGELNESQEKPLMRAMTMDGLCIFLDITDQTLTNYKSRGEDFLEVINKAERIIRTQKFQGAAAGQLHPNIIARDLGLKDATTSEHTGRDGGPIETSMSDNELARGIAFLLTKATKED